MGDWSAGTGNEASSPPASPSFMPARGERSSSRALPASANPGYSRTSSSRPSCSAPRSSRARARRSKARLRSTRGGRCCVSCSGGGNEAEGELLEFVANDPWLDERKGLLAPMVSVGCRRLGPDRRDGVRAPWREHFASPHCDRPWRSPGLRSVRHRHRRRPLGRLGLVGYGGESGAGDPGVAARHRHPPVRRGIRAQRACGIRASASRTSAPNMSSSPSWSRPR